MKRILSKLIVFSVVLCFFGVSVIAQDSGEGKEETSTGKVTFKAPDTDAGVVDPIDPGEVTPVPPIKPEEPENGGPTGSTGNLRIDSTPWFDFGTLVAGAKYQGVESINGTSWSESLQLSDLRFTENANWSLSARMSDFKAYKNGVLGTVDSLTGAINFSKPHIWSEVNTGNIPSAAFKLQSGAGSDVNILTNVEAPGSTVIDWFNRSNDPIVFGGKNDNITLDIDGTKALADYSYVAEITWTLQSGTIVGN